MATTKHPLQLVQPWEEDPEEVEGRAEEVDKESKHGEGVDDEEELGVWDDALVEQTVDVAVKEGLEDAGDVGVGGKEDGEDDGDDDLCSSAVKVRLVANVAVSECLSNLVEVPII